MSAGMSMEHGIYPVEPGGVVHLTDGGASSTACRCTDTGKLSICSHPSFFLQVKSRGSVVNVLLNISSLYHPMWGKFVPNHVCHGKPDGLQHWPHGRAGYTIFLPLAGCIDMEQDELLEGYYSGYQTQRWAFTLKTYGIDFMDEFSYYPPSIDVYPTVALPWHKMWSMFVICCQ